MALLLPFFFFFVLSISFLFLLHYRGVGLEYPLHLSVLMYIFDLIYIFRRLRDTGGGWLPRRYPRGSAEQAWLA
jgi:hypothetical protein